MKEQVQVQLLRIFLCARLALSLGILMTGLDSGTALASDHGSPPASENFYGKTVSKIVIEGLNRTRQENVLRELASKEGQPYTAETAREDPKRLDRLRIFSSYKIEVIDEKDSVVLKIQVREIFPYLPTLSLDVSDETGVSLGPGFKAINLFGKQVLLSVAARFGGATDFEVVFRNPWFAGNHMSYQSDFRYVDRLNELDNFNETSEDFGFQLGSHIGEAGRIGTRFRFLSLRSDIDGITLSDTNRDYVPKLSFFLGYDDRDLWSDTRNGWWTEVEVSRSGRFLGGDGDFWTLDLDVRRYQRLASHHTIALFSLTTLQTGRVGTEVPTYQDFHLGGTNTVRGWSLDSRHGKNQLINTLEYRYSLLEPRAFSLKGFSLYLGIHLALFGDMGMTWSQSGEFNGDNLIGGYGFGIRFLIPFIDVLRVDFALGEPDRGLRSFVGIEPKPVKQRKRIR